MTLRLNLQAARALLLAILTGGVMLSFQSCEDASGSPEEKTPVKREVPISFAPAAGTYQQPQRVSVSCTAACKQIRYTTNKTTPTITSPLYEGPILVGTTTVLLVSAFDSAGALIGSSTAIYRIEGIPWNIDIPYDSFVDDRDGQTYRSVKIGDQTWMAQNLNYAGQKSDTGVCYQNDPSECETYGRLYTWDEAMKGATSSSRTPSGIRGICPSGWHAPSDSEFITLLINVEADPRVGPGKAGIALKPSFKFWMDNFHPTTGTNLFGFTALAGGYLNAPSNFSAMAYEGDWWVTWIQMNRDYAKYFTLNTDETVVRSFIDKPSNSRSLRCVQD